MKKMILLAGLLLMAGVSNGADKKVPPNPANYPLTVHVLCSFLVQQVGIGNNFRRIAVTLNGKSLEMSTAGDGSVLALGDYKARLVKDSSPNAYEIEQTYEFLMPSGGLHTFTLTGFGNSLCPAAS